MSYQNRIHKQMFMYTDQIWNDVSEKQAYSIPVTMLQMHLSMCLFPAAADDSGIQPVAEPVVCLSAGIIHGAFTIKPPRNYRCKIPGLKNNSQNYNY